MKATAKAPANIAFIKYWGRKDERLRLPANNSISMNLSGVFTVTTVEFLTGLKKDEIEMIGEKFDQKSEERIVGHLDRVRRLAKIKIRAKVVTKNNFPKGTGIASSASGFAALTLAATKAAGLQLNQKQLSILARQGSGSACRSIPDGFVEWQAGHSNETSFAASLFSPGWWDIRDVIMVVEKAAKKVSSSQGHVLTKTSAFYQPRLAGIDRRIKKLKGALKKRNFKEFGEVVEQEAINMHSVMMTSKPALYYWLPKTMEIILATQSWREKGLVVYFTIDAGPNVHLICQNKDEQTIIKRLKKIRGIKRIISNQPSKGARLIKNHLF